MQNVKTIEVDGVTTTLTLESGETLTINATIVKMLNLPTSDPSVVGQLWADSTVVTVSAG